MIDPVSTASSAGTSATSVAPLSEPDPSVVTQFDAALAADPATTASDADLLAQINRNIQEDILRKIVTDTFKHSPFKDD